MCAPDNTGRTTIQRPRDGNAYAFCRRLGLAVADMCVAHRHARPLVVEQAADDGQRDSLQHGVAGERMTEIVHANVFDAGTLANFAPEPQPGRQRPPQIERRGEDEGARRSWLTVGGSRGVCRIRIVAEEDLASRRGLSSLLTPSITSAFAAHPVSAEAITFACNLLYLRPCDHVARKCPHLCYCIAFAEFLRINGFRDTSTAVVLAQTMNSPPISRLEYGPEGFDPVCMCHALEVLPDRGIGAFVIERRSSTRLCCKVRLVGDLSA